MAASYFARSIEKEMGTLHTRVGCTSDVGIAGDFFSRRAGLQTFLA